MNLLFIIGTGRCGSTMIHEVLARHPDAGFISNLDANVPALNVKGRWNNSIYRRMPSRLTQRDLPHLRIAGRPVRFGPSEAYRMLARHVSPLLAEPFRDLTAEDVTPWLKRRCTRFFVERMRVQAKPLFLCKLAGWPRAGFFHQVFPDAKFLRVIRDGRAVADSLVRRPWWDGYRGPFNWRFGPLPERDASEWMIAGRSFLVLAGLQWRLLMDAFEDVKERIPSQQWMEVRYEDFVDNPQASVERILEFVGLQWGPEFERAVLSYKFRRDMKDEFRRNLTTSQIELLDGVLADRLRRYGYRPDGEVKERGQVG
jgi:Fe-S-cluster formation regulator IscX/YfhJ